MQLTYGDQQSMLGGAIFLYPETFASTNQSIQLLGTSNADGNSSATIATSATTSSDAPGV